jgi:hypothetical protein
VSQSGLSNNLQQQASLYLFMPWDWNDAVILDQNNVASSLSDRNESNFE